MVFQLILFSQNESRPFDPGIIFLSAIPKKTMAQYSKKAGDKVERAMHEMKEGELKSGRSEKKVTNPKQAIAIGLSEAREEGAKVPRKHK
jgi:uncharacterized protein DUF6496